MSTFDDIFTRAKVICSTAKNPLVQSLILEHSDTMRVRIFGEYYLIITFNLKVFYPAKRTITAMKG